MTLVSPVLTLIIHGTSSRGSLFCWTIGFYSFLTACGCQAGWFVTWTNLSPASSITMDPVILPYTPRKFPNMNQCYNHLSHLHKQRLNVVKGKCACAHGSTCMSGALKCIVSPQIKTHHLGPLPVFSLNFFSFFYLVLIILNFHVPQVSQHNLCYSQQETLLPISLRMKHLLLTFFFPCPPSTLRTLIYIIPYFL